MAEAATRTSNIYTRVDSDTKDQAETILDQFGIPMSNAIGTLLKQIILQRGIPFDMKLPVTTPLSIYSITNEQFDMEMPKSIDDIAVGYVSSIDSVEEEMRRLCEI